MVKVVVNNGQYKLTIPKELALSKGWRKDTRLRFVEDINGNIFLKEVIELEDNPDIESNDSSSENRSKGDRRESSSENSRKSSSENSRKSSSENMSKAADNSKKTARGRGR